MITGIDHLALSCAEPTRGASDLAAVLGRTPVTVDAPTRAAFASLRLENLAVRVLADETTAGPTASSIRLVLATTDLDETARRLARRALPGTMRDGEAILDLDPSTTYGVPISVAAASTPALPSDGSDIAGLDHIVIRTPDPERAVALYGGRLGLDLRLDRSNPAYASRMLFFVCGGLVVEVTHDLKAGGGSGPDQVWGLAWRAHDIGRAHARMAASGIDVSEVRDGRRPGTQVFTVKSHTLDVPTLVIGGDGLQRS